MENITKDTVLDTNQREQNVQDRQKEQVIIQQNEQTADAKLTSTFGATDTKQVSAPFAQISSLSKQGYFLLKHGQIDGAVQMFQKILKIEPDNSYALVGAGDAYKKKGAIQKAIEYYNSCLALYPTNNYAIFGLGDCYKALRDYQKAIDIWQQYDMTGRQNVAVLTRIADAYRKLNDFEHSRDLYLKVLEKEENNNYALIGLGHLFYDHKDYSTALTYWQKVLDNSPVFTDIRVLTAIGNCHRKLKDFEEGLEFFQKALQKEDNNFYALFGLADCYRGLKMQDKAIETWNKLLLLDPRNKVILTRAGDAYRTQGNLDKATDYYQRALKVDFDSYAFMGQALVLKDKGEYESAIVQLKQLLKRDKSDPRFFIELASCYQKIGNLKDALSLLQEYQTTDDKNDIVNAMIENIKQEI